MIAEYEFVPAGVNDTPNVANRTGSFAFNRPNTHTLFFLAMNTIVSDELPATEITLKAGIWPRMRIAIFVIAILLCLTPWFTPPIALAMGAVLAIAIGNPFPKVTKKSGKLLLQICVVMLGFSMDLPSMLRAGSTGFILAAIGIVVALGAGYLLGRLLGVNRMTGALISTGTAICGGSAIAAMGATLESSETDITVAMGTVFLLNGVALYLFPIIGGLLGLTQHQFGTWAGLGIHDVSSAVGAGAAYGLGALQTATAVKLSRALWIVPVVLVMAWAYHRGTRKLAVANADFGFTPEAGTDESPAAPKRAKIQIPWFIALFILAGLARTFIPIVGDVAEPLTRIATIGFTVTLFLVGAQLSRKTLRSVGVPAMALGVGLWLIIGGGALWAAMHLA
jgi:uncharacterized membrane protein YadS